MSQISLRGSLFCSFRPSQFGAANPAPHDSHAFTIPFFGVRAGLKSMRQQCEVRYRTGRSWRRCCSSFPATTLIRITRKRTACSGGRRCCRSATASARHRALAVAGIRRGAFARRRPRQSRGAVSRPRCVVGPRHQGAVPHRQREARGGGLWRACRRRPIGITNCAADINYYCGAFAAGFAGGGASTSPASRQPEMTAE